MEKEFQTRLNHDQYFAGLARQDVDFHQALGELIDNAVSAYKVDEVGQEQAVTVEITVEELGGDQVRLQIADSGRGMGEVDLTDRVFNPGGQGTQTGPLNEHGFGLKNALALLTAGNKHNFTLLTRDLPLEGDLWYKVEGPYSCKMRVVDGTRAEWASDLVYLSNSLTGTKITVTVERGYLRTIYRRTSNFESLMTRLGEHIGVMHRNFVRHNANRIFLRYKPLGAEWINKRIQAIELPIEGSSEVRTITVDVAGITYKAKYSRGLLDYTVKDPDAEQRLGWPYPLRIYYQGSNARCGIDVTVRKRVVLTGQFETIWPDIKKDFIFNRFIGEIELDESFRTTNNKTALDPHGKNWEALLTKLREDFLPQRTVRSQSEESLRTSLKTILQGTFTHSHITADKATWDGGCEVDLHVVVSTDPKQLRIYELKVVPSRVLDVYQLVMAWDGLVEDGQTPTHAILVAKEHGSNVKKAVSVINGRSDAKGNKYNIELKTVDELVPSL